MDRRNFLCSTAAIAAFSLSGIPFSPLRAREAQSASDESFWQLVREQYDITNEITNLEAGYWGIMPIPTTEAFIRNTHFLNRNNTHYVRGAYAGDYNAIIRRLAIKLGVGEDELVLTRNATESLRSLIGGYNKLNPGDTVIYADTDYGTMQIEMRYLATSRKANVVKIVMPEPASYQDVIDAWENALDQNPNCKMILITHLSNRTGLISPAREITRMARARGVDVILDAAHSWGQFDFDFQELGVDFVGFNLHKWIAAPLGVGMMYIRKNRVLDIDPFHGEAAPDNSDIRTRVHTGTMSFASVLTIPAALDFQENIGIENISGRLRFLRNQWVGAVRDNPRLEILTPDDERMHAGITSFRIKGITSDEENAAIVRLLNDKYGIFTVNIGGLAGGGAVRVSPALYNLADDAVRLGAALNEMTGG
jgi:selenocysteine lyase/cysteine desulfurase